MRSRGSASNMEAEPPGTNSQAEPENQVSIEFTFPRNRGTHSKISSFFEKSQELVGGI